MNASRPQTVLAPAAAPSPGPGASWSNFWFAPIDPVGLHALRVLAGLLFLLWLLPFAGQQEALFGLNGWFDARAYHEASHLQRLPPHLFSWSVLYLCGTSPVLLGIAYWLSIATLVLFTLGLWTRVTGVLTYVGVVSFTANPAISYDVDPLLVMLAFYLMVGYLLLGQRRPGLSVAARLLGPTETRLFRGAAPRGTPPLPPSAAANLAVRLLQVHFAVVMIASALNKLQVREWWSGLAGWFYLNQPFHTTLQDVRNAALYAEWYLIVLSLASYLALAWQLAFPAFAWRRRWRVVLLGGAGLAWLADAFLLRLPLLGPVMVVGCLSYLTPAEWRRLSGFLGRLWPARRRLHGAPAERFRRPGREKNRD
jgi:hypothetical protein